jgi:hypothetical protein
MLSHAVCAVLCVVVVLTGLSLLVWDHQIIVRMLWFSVRMAAKTAILIDLHVNITHNSY